MRSWDLSGGAARLEESLDMMKTAWLQASEHWNDSTSERFYQKQIEPMEPKARRALDAIRRVDEVLARAFHALNDD